MMSFSKHSRYPGIRSFEKDESKLFFGRSTEIRELYSLIKVERLAVLFSKSGIGKTSLLNAGVLPALEEEDYLNIQLRFQNRAISPIDNLKQQLKAQLEALDLGALVDRQIKKWCGTRQPSNWEYLKACEMVMAYLPAQPLLVLDQFEEFFSHDIEAQEEFTDLLAQLTFSRVPRELQKWAQQKGQLSARDEKWLQPLDYKLVVAIRSDRLSLLENLSTRIPAILDNRYQLHPLNRKQATEAILLPAQSEAYENFSSPPFHYKDDALEAIIKNLSNDKGEIESFQLQIICRHLEDIVLNEGLEEIQNKHIGGADGIAEVLNSYYEKRIQSLGDEKAQQLARQLIEEGLIVEGARVGLAEAIVAKRYSISKELLQKIEDTRIIKAENTHLGKAYEIAHDTLVEPILKSLENRQLKEARLAAAAERQQLEQEAKAEREKAALEAKKRRRSNLIAAIAIVLAGISIAVGALAFYFMIRSNKATKKAEKLTTQLTTKRDELQDTIQQLSITKENLSKKIDDYKKANAGRLALEFEDQNKRWQSVITAGFCGNKFFKRMDYIAKEYPENKRFKELIEERQKQLKARKDIGKDCIPTDS